jgi:uroporphyrinogen-III synthase
MAGTAAGVAVAIMTPRPQAKTVCNTLRNKGRVINIEPLDIGF